MAFLDNLGVSKLCALLKDKFDSLWTAVNGKQGALTAGSNITISDGVISATDTTYTAGTNVSISNGVISATDTNTTYTAGTGINIDANNEISCTVSGGSSYTAGTGINIDSNNVINNKYPLSVIGQPRWLYWLDNIHSDGYMASVNVTTETDFIKYINLGYIVIPLNTMNIDLTKYFDYDDSSTGTLFKLNSNNTWDRITSYSYNNYQLKNYFKYFRIGEILCYTSTENNSYNIPAYSMPIYSNKFSHYNLFSALEELADKIPSNTNTNGDYKLVSSATAGNATYNWVEDNNTPKYCSFTLPMLIAKNLQNTNNTWWVDLSGSFISSESGLPDLTLSELTTQLKNQGFAIVWCQNNNTSIDMTTIGTEYSLSYISGPNTSGGISQAYNFSAGFYLFYISNKTLFFVKTPAQLRTDWGSYIPAAPSADGDYLLKCSVSSGTPTYSWGAVTTGGS